ncbi:MAG TPA: hypothetical protein VIH05_00965 [Tepidiformaceae bacterium]|jgi:hypothetical protein
MSSTHQPLGRRPDIEPSLFHAADLLDDALAADSADPAWYTAVRAALRKCTLAVEYQLDNLASGDGLGSLASEEPRLGPALERLERELAELLLAFWRCASPGGLPAPGFAQRARKMSSMLRQAAAREFDFVHEAFNPTGALD